MFFGGPAKVEGDDEVVASFGIYFSPSLANNCHVFQYPMRQKQRPYEMNEAKLFCTSGVPEGGHGGGTKSVLSPMSRLTMRCSLDTFGSSSFRESREDSANGMSDTKQHVYEYTLQSQPFHPRSEYMVGRIFNGGIHLTPVSTIQQFTPAVGNGVSAGVSAQADGAAPETRKGALRVDEHFCSTHTSPVIPGLAGSDRIQRELLRQRSAMLNSDAATAREINLFPATSVESATLRKRLISSSLESAAKLETLSKNSKEVENSLYPPEILTSGGITGGEDVASSTIIRRFADRSSVLEQVQQLMDRCQVLPLNVVSANVTRPLSDGTADVNGNKVPDAQLVDALKVYATNMHGVWVSRRCEFFKGLTAALREVVLAVFSQSVDGAISRAQLNQLVLSSVLRRAAKDILETVSELNAQEKDPSQRRWRLKYVAADPQERNEAIELFRSSFPAEEAAQREAWAARVPQIMTHVPYINAHRQPPTLYLASRASSGGAGTGRANAIGGVVRGAPVAHVPSQKQQQQQVPGGGGSATVSEAEVATVRHCIRTLFAEHGVLHKMRAKQLVLRERDAHFPHVSRDALRIGLQSSVREFTRTTWVLQSLGEPTVDRFRPRVLELLLELQTFETRAVLARLEAQQGDGAEPVPSQVVQRIVSEVAEYRQGERLWYLKVGEAPNME